MKKRIGLPGLIVAVTAAALVARAGARQPLPWDCEALFKTPATYDAPAVAGTTNGVRALFYDNEPYQGRPTRVFAYYGCPKTEPGKRVPGMVLLHGGGGTAYLAWVRLWNSRGYAAIAMDLCGSVPNESLKWPFPYHAWAGPDGKSPVLHAAEPERDQWPYHAVAAAVRAHSLLRSFPEVDAGRTGVMGISWGGYVTCIAASVDSRFAFAVPVYGCGFLSDNSMWLDQFEQIGAANAKRWTSLWDPSVYLPLSKVPFLWVTGSNDRAYPLDSLRKSCRRLEVPPRLCVRLRMPHGHIFHIKEAFAFADGFAPGGRPLPSFTTVQRDGRKVSAAFSGASRKVIRAELNYTLDTGAWQQRVWQAAPARLASGTVEAEIPDKASVYYFNLVTDDDLVVSSAHEELREK